MILNSFLGCSSIHVISSLVSFKTKEAANLISCISFQLYFISRCISLFYQSCYTDEYDPNLVSQQTIDNLNSRPRNDKNVADEEYIDFEEVK